VRDGRGQFDVAHALAAHLAGDDLDAAFLAHDAAVLHALVFAAIALVVLHGAEDLGAEQAVALRLEGAIVYGLRLFDFAEAPLADFLRRGDGYLNGLEIASGNAQARRSTHGEQFVQAHEVPS
jgi:hypothetical protein